MHSKGKLALAVFTSPGAAFEEILERRMLGPALWIVGITGLVAMLAAIGKGIAYGSLEFFTLGINNPVIWFGLFLLYAIALQLLLKWINVDTDFVKIMIVMGWSQMALLLAQVAMSASAVVLIVDKNNLMAAEVLSKMIAPACYLWYAGAIGFGLQAAFGMPLKRAIAAYAVIATGFFLAFTVTYANSRLAVFAASPKSIIQTASQIVSVDKTPWMVAGVVGLFIGLVKLSKELNWDKATKWKLIASTAVVSVFALGYYVTTLSDTDYYGKVNRADRQLMEAGDTYEDNETKGKKAYEEAAVQIERLLPINRSSDIMMLIADTYYLAGDSDRSIDYYNKSLALAKETPLPETEGSNAAAADAHIYNRVGAVYHQQGEYDKALAEFEKSIKAWPKFRDPWVRKAVTYARMGENDKAIEAGNHAVQKLGSESAIVWIALAQAFTEIGDKKQAGVAVTMATDKDKALIKRIGGKDWSNAVQRLTDRDLRFPLEKEPATAPEQPKTKSAGKNEQGKK